MTALSRRSLFGMFAGALAAPTLAKLPTFTPEAFATAPRTALSMQEIIAVTLRYRAAAIVDNLARENPLVRALKVRA